MHHYYKYHETACVVDSKCTKYCDLSHMTFLCDNSKSLHDEIDNKC